MVGFGWFVIVVVSSPLYSPPFVVTATLVRIVVFAFHEQAVHPGSLGDAAVGVIHCALPVWLVIDGVDLACVGSPLACLRVREGHAEHHGPLRRRRGGLMLMMWKRPLLLMMRMRLLIISIPPTMIKMLMPRNVLLAHDASTPIHGTILRRRPGSLALPISMRRQRRRLLRGVPLLLLLATSMMPPFHQARMSLAPHFRNTIVARAMLATLPIPIPIAALLLFLLPVLTIFSFAATIAMAITVAAAIVIVLLGANLIADAAHLVETAFRTVSYYYFPSSEEFLLA
mmetsp:Transcript_2022/g.4366  ORF Transcript_2022/g.4366 Transcript_2022/m.4366 type:complete len:285 (-) Transcript_2022:124-978(-)